MIPFPSRQHSQELQELQHQFQNQTSSSNQQSSELQPQFQNQHEMFQQFMLFQQMMSQQQSTKYSNHAVIENKVSQFDSLPSSSLHSRTTSENSNVYYTPPDSKSTFKGSAKSPAEDIQLDHLKFITKTSRKRKKSNGDGSGEVSHHFQIPAISLTQTQFSTRLTSILTKEVMEEELSHIFPELSVFRNKFIIPLSRQITEGKTDTGPNEDTSPKNPIALTVDMKDVLTAEELEKCLEGYVKIFQNGCHVKRKKRAVGQPSTPDTPERCMYRNFLSVLWLKLGKTY